MVDIKSSRKEDLIIENSKDLSAFQNNDQALYDRLIVDNEKVESMIQSVRDVIGQEDPVDQVISAKTLPSG